MSLDNNKYMELPGKLSVEHQIIQYEQEGSGLGFVFFYRVVPIEEGGAKGVPEIDLVIHMRPIFRCRNRWYVCDADSVAKSAVDAAVTTVRGIMEAAKGLKNGKD